VVNDEIQPDFNEEVEQKYRRETPLQIPAAHDTPKRAAVFLP